MKNRLYDKMYNDITQTELKSKFDYDVKNGWLIRKFKSGKSKPCGHKPTRHGYGCICINNKMYITHRLIWLWFYGEFPSEFIDHIDGNKVNNRIENLREVDQKINMHNQKIRNNNTSGFTGVNFHKQNEKYQVKINNKYIGLFDTYEKAVRAAKEAKIKYHPTSPDAILYAEELGISL